MTSRLRAFLRSAKSRLLDFTIIGVCVVTIGVLIAGDHLRRGDIAFDAERWRADRTGCSFYTSGVRSQMSKDLAQSLLASNPRHRKPEVERMLGPPDAGKSRGAWHYSAGTSTMDCLTFNVEFDESGAVRDAYLTQR
ncbi:MAG: hypothetical protein EHM59_08305 [Betaproteobacteria bacterium]|nr:MAG: hypothetical protein EHM59_08305 [Betaproteobacteria bacterium]